jgi:hypothetical protein
MPIAVWLFALAIFCFFSERFALSLWLTIAALVAALLEKNVAKKWPAFGWTSYETNLTTKEYIVKAGVKLSVTSALCFAAWYLSILTAGYLDHIFDSTAHNVGR